VSQIVDTIAVKQLGEDEVVLTGSLRQDVIPVLEENYVTRMNTNNGFSKKRMFRKIASVPLVAVLKAGQEGYNLDDPKDLRRFLDDNPGYKTVANILTPRDSRLIVK